MQIKEMRCAMSIKLQHMCTKIDEGETRRTMSERNRKDGSSGQIIPDGYTSGAQNLRVEYHIYSVQAAVTEEVCDYAKCSSGILVEVQVVACPWMKVRRELCLLVEGFGRFVKDARTVAVADNVIGLSGDGLMEDVRYLLSKDGRHQRQRGSLQEQNPYSSSPLGTARMREILLLRKEPLQIRQNQPLSVRNSAC